MTARAWLSFNHGHDTRALQAYLGHRNIENKTRSTALAPDRFKFLARLMGGGDRASSSVVTIARLSSRPMPRSCTVISNP